MSTKTSIKRIALVAVSALGFGLLSVVPARAATTAIDATGGVLTTATALYTTVGTAVTTTVTLDSTTNADATQSLTITPAVTTSPAGSQLSVGAPGAAKVGMDLTGADTTVIATTATASKWLASTSAGVNTYAFSSVAGPAFADEIVGTISITPDVPGKYSITLTAGDGTNNRTAVVYVYATGTALTVAQTGVGTVNGVGVAGGQVSFSYTTPNGTATGTKYNVTVTGGNLINGTGIRSDNHGSPTANNPTNINGTTAADGLTFTTTGETTSGVYTFNAAIPTAGTFTATISSINASTGVPTVVGRVVVTVTATASSSISAPLSSAFIGTGLGTTCPTADATSSALRFSSTAGTVANICVTLRDINGAAINGQAVSVTVSGPGLLIAEADVNGVTGTPAARVAALTATQMASTNTFQVGIASDGTAGASTVTISAGTTVIATKSLSFFGSVATLEVTQSDAIARSGITSATLAASANANRLGTSDSAADGLTVATSSSAVVVAKDKDGNVVPGLTITAVIGDATVLSSVEIAEAAGVALTNGAAGRGNYLVAVRSAIGGVSGKSTTVTFRTPNPLVPSAFIEAKPITYTLGGTRTGGTVTMTLNKSTYAPGERMILTFKALDASGNKVVDGTATGTPSASKNVQGLAAGEYVDGEFILGDDSTEFLYAPTVSGPFTLTLPSGTSATATITTTATVSDDAATAAANAASDAAAEAIDAANAATDAANLAAEAADAATVAAEEARDAADAATAAVEKLASDVATLMASLKAQITTLANTVAKIAKKVKA